MRSLALLLMGCALGGCAATATPLPERLTIPDFSLTTPDLRIVDMRPEGNRVRRTVQLGGTYQFFGDAEVSPALPDLVSSTIGASLPPKYRDRPVEIVRVDVGFWRDSVDMSGVRAPAPVPGVGAAPYAIGSVIGGGVVYAIKAANAREAAVVNIDVRVDGHSITAAEILPLSSAPNAALQRAVSNSLKTISEKVAAMAQWTGP